MTLKELLKDKPLPCKVVTVEGYKYSIHATTGLYAFGFKGKSEAVCLALDSTGYFIHTEPKKMIKKTMYLPIEDNKTWSRPCINYGCYETKEKALEHSKDAIGYQEIEVQIYE